MVDSSPGDRTRPALVLQRLDGVPWGILLDVNRHAPPPDLAVILTAEPGPIAEHIATRGVTHRFHLALSAPGREVELYADAASRLMRQGVKVLLLDTNNAAPTWPVHLTAVAVRGGGRAAEDRGAVRLVGAATTANPANRGHRT